MNCALRGHELRHDAEARRAHGHQVRVARQNLDGHARLRIRRFPVVAEATLLDHVEQLVVVQRPGRAAGGVGRRRFVVVYVDRADLVVRLLVLSVRRNPRAGRTSPGRVPTGSKSLPSQERYTR